MHSKKLGILMIIISLVFAVFLFDYINLMNERSNKLGCNSAEGCFEVRKNLDLSHLAFGFFGFMLALGFYFLVFNNTEKRIFEKLEDEKNKKVEEERFKIILKALDEYERKVMEIVKEQEGITQNTLKLRANISKAKLSYILQELERRDLIIRNKKGKTLEVHLKI
ncbi:MAG: winged helix-turn-helix transcriptional regulator [Nanoarchaeota archaeon]